MIAGTLKTLWMAAGAAMLLLALSSADATTIAEAVRKGLLRSPEVRAAQAEEGAAETDIDIAKAGYYPNVSISGGPGSFQFDDLNYDLSVAQMLHDWGRVRSTVAGARATRRRVSEQVRVRRDEIALDVAETYLDILVTRRQIEALEGHLALLDQVRDMTVSRAQGGYADRGEQERTALEIARAREQLALERGTLTNAENEYKLLVGADPVDLDEPAPASVASYVARNDFSELIAQAPAYRTAAEDIGVAEARWKEAKASLYPQLNVEATTLRRDVGGIARSDSMVAVRFRMNNLQGMSSFLRPRGAEQRVQSARLSAAAIERDTRRQVQTLFDSAATLRERETSLETQVASSGDLGITYLEQFQAGRRDLIDLLTAHREQFDARRQLINVHVERLRAEYRAAARLGLIGPLLENGLH